MGLFDKKYCSVCNGKIGLLGNRKLEDGNLCKDCAANLSLWFDERRHSTVDQIKDQLDYREANRDEVAKFTSTRTYGEKYFLHLDENNRKFLVASSANWQYENPDVLSFSQVTGCELDVKEEKQEQWKEVKDADGRTKRVSFDPPHYVISYTFQVLLRVSNPFFDEMRFQLNKKPVEIEVIGKTPIVDPGKRSPKYQEYERMAAEIKEALLAVREQARDEIAVANEPKKAVICPNCGASSIPDANGCCEYCGGALL